MRKLVIQNGGAASTVFRINKQSSWFFRRFIRIDQMGKTGWIRECETFSFSQS